MMKSKKITKTLALTLIAAILGSFMNLSIASATPLDKPVPQTSKSESKIKVPETTNAQTNIDSNNSGIDIQLNDGETVKIPLLKKSPTKITGVSRANSIPEIGTGSNAYGSVTFSRSGNIISYSIELYMAYTNITGTLSATDYYSGLSAGFEPFFLPSGSFTCNGLTGHTYRLTLQGTASLLTEPVATIFAQAGWTKQ